MVKDTRINQDKRKALYAIYLQGLRDGRFVSMRAAGEWIAKQPAPHFYISPESASFLVGRIINGKSLSNLHSQQRHLVRQLHHDYLEYLQSHPTTTKSRVQIMNELVDRPAPEFYMTGDAVRRALREEIAKVKKKIGWGE